MNTQKFSVQLRGGFSDRNGIKKESVQIQIGAFDLRTRIALINATKAIYAYYRTRLYSEKSQSIIKKILSEVYLIEVDWGKSYDEDKIIDIICKTIREDTYDSVLSVIEYYANLADGNWELNRVASQTYNEVFEKEFVGYRFVNSIIVAISDPTEISEIEQATTSPYNEVNTHVGKAVKLLSDRSSPDYANSIKESISAVERMCSLIIGRPTTLGAALDRLEKSGLKIHVAMKTAFEKLYGYTNDSSGIRHSGQLGGTDSTFEEAKFMLVSCCAFVNYLIGVWAKNQ